MSAQEIADNIARIQVEIAAACAKANRDPADVTLVAVSKRKPATDILAAIAAGVQHFGENRVNEANEKVPFINEQVEEKPIWHMIGHVQSRKAKAVVPLFDIVEAVDSVKVAEKLSQQAVVYDKTLPILLEINISGEEAKQGFTASNWQADDAIKAALWEDIRTILALPALEVRGLMTMAPFYSKMEDTRPIFASLSELRQIIIEDFDVNMAELSMGMTNDYPVAIEEGATMIRVGRAIFGERI